VAAGASEDEIFRKPGNAKRVKELMALVNSGVEVDFLARMANGDWLGFHWLRFGCRYSELIRLGFASSIHDLVSLLKGYTNHLDEPLVPYHHNEFYCQAAGDSKKGKQTQPSLL
jgi:hypothetical protein